MKESKLDTITNLFKGKEIRSIWDGGKEDYYFSVVDVISVLIGSNIPKRYWIDLKKRLIESVPSRKAEPFKMWLASLGNERIDEVFEPEKAINRSINYYCKKGYEDNWIEVRLKGILNREKLTDIWKYGGITEDFEYALLTNEIYKTWFGMKASEYKEYKGIRKESLRDNMSDIEVILTDLGEFTARDITLNEKPKGLKDNLSVAKRGGNVAKGARDLYEKETKKKTITSSNYMGKRYIGSSNEIDKG